MVPAIPAGELSESAGGVWANPKGFRCVMTSFDRLIETRWAYAVLAGLVMLTRISIKVRLAWSTTAQMGFMVMECGLGLYTLAALHLVGHSLYKAHAFLSASAVVRQTRLQALRTATATQPAALWLAPLVAVSLVAALQGTLLPGAWPWWWTWRCAAGRWARCCRRCTWR
mgnify:CR=1 FL=1